MNTIINIKDIRMLNKKEVQFTYGKTTIKGRILRRTREFIFFGRTKLKVCGIAFGNKFEFETPFITYKKVKMPIESYEIKI